MKTDFENLFFSAFKQGCVAMAKEMLPRDQYNYMITKRILDYKLAKKDEKRTR